MQFINLPNDICVKVGDEIVRPMWLAVDENMQLHAFDVKDGKCSEIPGAIITVSPLRAALAQSLENAMDKQRKREE